MDIKEFENEFNKLTDDLEDTKEELDGLSDFSQYYSDCMRDVIKLFIKFIMEKQMKREIKIRWTCSNFIHHEHKWKFIAWICGRMQWLINKLKNK